MTKNNIAYLVYIHFNNKYIMFFKSQLKTLNKICIFFVYLIMQFSLSMIKWFFKFYFVISNLIQNTEYHKI